MKACKTTRVWELGTLCVVCFCVGVAFAPANGSAQLVTLIDGSSEAQILPDSQAGVFNWSVNGEDQLSQQWYWVQVNGQRFSIDALTLGSVSQPALNKSTLSYTDGANGYDLTASFELTGAGVESLLKETVTIQNNSGSPLEISLVMYSDFDLNGTAGGDSASLFGLNDSDVIFGNTVGWAQAAQSDGIYEHTAIFNGWPLLGEVDFFANTLNKLNGGLDPLSLDAGSDLPATAGATSLSEYGPVGPGDVTYAIQWDFEIPAGDVAGIGIDKRLVTPEPGTAMLTFLGMLVLLRARRRIR